MRKLSTLATLMFALLLVGIAPASAAGNDYPYSTAAPGVSDPWGMTERQCTSFVAWRSHQNGQDIPGKTGGRGAWTADRWDDNAAQLRKKVDRRATVGGFAQWNAHEHVGYTYQGRQYSMTAGDMGHIAYVASVNADGTVTLQDYNWFGGSRAYGTRTLPATAVPRYIH
ncbi:CHAP domain-containing protein [Actinomycetospora sp. CA-101289]|uniref:CHAP domain-containing protein n=1 Tax=Actinomycetospora sp. CA-101289 TaxID=3239893 RepID=UPI003D96D9B3